MSSLSLVCFGSIGAIAHSSEIQWNCFNAALEDAYKAGKLSKQITWDQETYIKSLVSTGGKRRLKEHLSNSEGSSAIDVTDELVEAIYQKKTELFIEAINSGAISVRPGVKELLEACKELGIKTAFCTTTDHRVAKAITAKLGLDSFFELQLNDQCLPKFGNNNKPLPDCYLYVVDTLLGKTDAITLSSQVVAFEDTEVSIASSVSAGIVSIGIPNKWAVDQDFSKAFKKISEVSDLGADGKSIVVALEGVIKGA